MWERQLNNAVLAKLCLKINELGKSPALVSTPLGQAGRLRHGLD